MKVATEGGVINKEKQLDRWAVAVGAPVVHLGAIEHFSANPNRRKNED